MTHETNPDEPIFHLRSYGDVTRAQLDELTKQRTNPDVWPELPIPEGCCGFAEHGVASEVFTADQMRTAQKQMARECWRELLYAYENNEAWIDESGLAMSLQILSERFGPFDE